MKRCKIGLANSCEGNVIVEFAMVGPILFAMIIGLIEFGRYYYFRSEIQFAADEAGRYAIVYVSASSDVIAQQVSQNVSAVNPASLTITIQNQTVGGKSYKGISVAYNFVPLTGLLPMPTTINVQSSVPILP